MSLRSGLLIVGLGIVLAAASLLLVTGKLDTCPAALIGSEHQTTGPLLCQLEFFLNRYQTLLGSLIALSAAVYAVGPVWRQLRLLSVQAASDLLPRLREEAEELSADEGCMANAGHIAAKLHTAQQYARDPHRAVDVRVGSTIGEIQSIGQSILSLRSSGAVDHFASRITLIPNHSNCDSLTIPKSVLL
jgi:hypothetical protein